MGALHARICTDDATSISSGVTVASDPTCFTGLRSGSACCAASCGSCGGSGCIRRLGGERSCCTGAITRNGRPCGDWQPPCVIVKREPHSSSTFSARNASTHASNSTRNTIQPHDDRGTSTSLGAPSRVCHCIGQSSPLQEVSNCKPVLAFLAPRLFLFTFILSDDSAMLYHWIRHYLKLGVLPAHLVVVVRQYDRPAAGASGPASNRLRIGFESALPRIGFAHPSLTAAYALGTCLHCC